MTREKLVSALEDFTPVRLGIVSLIRTEGKYHCDKTEDETNRCEREIDDGWNWE
jgi:hypothetical protein